MKQILVGNTYAIVDNEDYERVSRIKWHLHVGYARGNYWDEQLNKWKKIRMHRLVFGAKKNEQLDHKNGNRLDNRKGNLRIASYSQNLANRGISKNNTTGYRGVVFFKRYKLKKPWIAQITINKNPRYLGYFLTKEEAARKYNEMAKKYFGEFAYLNRI